MPAAALRSAVLRFAAMLDLGGRQGLAALRAFIHSIPCRLARPIVVANATGTRIGMTRAQEPHCQVQSPAVSRAQTRTFRAVESSNPRSGDRGIGSGPRTA
jgi:hypothetical protein